MSIINTNTPHPNFNDITFKVNEQLEIGRKYDGDKPEYGLLPPVALEEISKVLTFGAKKYERENWRYVPDAERRYFDALQRHLWAWKRGEINDEETGLSHLAHAGCCLMFLVELADKSIKIKALHDHMSSLNATFSTTNYGETR